MTAPPMAGTHVPWSPKALQSSRQSLGPYLRGTRAPSATRGSKVHAPLATRVRDLVSRLTRQEKLNLVTMARPNQNLFFAP